MMGELITSQKTMQRDVQTYNDAIHSIQQAPQSMLGAQKDQKTSIDTLSRHMSQIANTLNEMKGNQGILSSQAHLNPKGGDAMLVTLCSGKELRELPKKNQDQDLESEAENHSDLEKQNPSQTQSCMIK